MFDPDCIFCKIIQKQISSKIIAENEYVLAIEDIAPKAPIHYLILPKKHIININYLIEEDSVVSWHILKMAQNVSKRLQKEADEKEPVHFNLLSNNGAGAGQCVFHMHWHFLSGKKLYVDGLSL
jgi:histidine triad (HIT) family protein